MDARYVNGRGQGKAINLFTEVHTVSLPPQGITTFQIELVYRFVPMMVMVLTWSNAWFGPAY